MNAAPSLPGNLLVSRRTLWVVVCVLAVLAAVVFVPCGISLVIASWVALLTRPWMLKLARRFRGRTSAAAVVTSTVVIAVLGPILLALIPVVVSAAQLARDLGRSQRWRDVAANLMGDGTNEMDLVQFARTHVAGAWGAVSTVLSTSATVLFGIAMFIVGLFSLSAHGERVSNWLRAHTPLAPSHYDRLASAYSETGRGLIVGVGVTALIQGFIATLTYVAVGIPRALALGLLTTVGALVPGIGTLLVWGPVTAILAVGGYGTKAIIVGLSGVVLIGSVDNFVKPVLSTRARLKLPSVLVFVTMLSGVIAFGPAGLLLGPLFVRLAMEALEMARDEGMVGVGAVIVDAAAPADGQNPSNRPPWYTANESAHASTPV